MAGRQPTLPWRYGIAGKKWSRPAQPAQPAKTQQPAANTVESKETIAGSGTVAGSNTIADSNTAASATTAASLTRSDSTLPVTFLAVSDLRIWSWELGDKECVQSGIVKVGDTKGNRKLTLYCHAESKLNAQLNVCCVELISAKQTNLSIKLNIDANRMYIVEHTLSLIAGSYIFKFTCDQKLSIISMSITE